MNIQNKANVKMREMKEELIEKLKEKITKEFKIVLMPHFCVDNIIQYKETYGSFTKKLEKIVNRGGGNLVIKQDLQRGGKAANCASALASLGFPPYLIVKTNELGYKLLEYFFAKKDVILSHVSKGGELAFTTAIELKGANIMISYPGSVSKFGPKDLTDKDKKLIREADIVSISDWGINEKGTYLTKYVFNVIKKEGKGKTFFDPGDSSPKGNKEKAEIERLLKEILAKGMVDILSVNEDEVKRYGRVANFRMAIDYLRKMTRVDLHTKDYARSFSKDKETERIPTFEVQPKRLTGAGDAWNAGDIFGELMGLSDNLRLMLANAVAAYYISEPKGNHPTREDLIKFLEVASFKKEFFNNLNF
jgi:ribokinase